MEIYCGGSLYPGSDCWDTCVSLDHLAQGRLQNPNRPKRWTQLLCWSGIIFDALRNSCRMEHEHRAIHPGGVQASHCLASGGATFSIYDLTAMIIT